MLEELEIKNWRNLSNKIISFKSGLNIIIGPNGAGKTSILEALYFALTSQTKSQRDLVKYKKFGTNFLEINLSIDSNHRSFSINRRYTNRLLCKINQNNITLFRNKRDVNRYITEFFNIDRNLFYNLIYSGEGEIYKSQFYIGKYPIVEYIESLMGFSKLNMIKKETVKLNNFLKDEKKNISIKISQLNNLQFESKIPTSDLKDELERTKKIYEGMEKNLGGLVDRLTDFKAERRYKRQLFEKNQKRIDSVKSSIKDLFIEDLKDIKKIGQYSEEISKRITNSNKKKEELYDKNSALRENIGKNLSLIEMAGENLKMLVNIPKSNNLEINCPLCERKMKNEELYRLREKNELIIELKTNENNDYQLKIKENEEYSNRLQLNLKELGDLQKNIEFLNQEIDYDSLKEDLIKLDKKIKKLVFEKEKYQTEERFYNKKIQNIQSQLINVKTNLKMRKIENYEHNLNSIKLGLIINRIIIDSINETVDSFKLDLIQPLVKKMVEIGNDLFPNDERKLSIDKDLLPIMKIGDNILNFKQLSSGEKTFLLILTKTLIIRYFSKIPFLILDEPIEHLDEDNRNLIIEYLYKLSKDKVVDQLIVTTYEESIVRKFLNLDNVNIIALDPSKL